MQELIYKIFGYGVAGIFAIGLIFAVLSFFGIEPSDIPFLQFKPYEAYVYAFPDSDKAKNYRLKAKFLSDYELRIYFYNGGSLHLTCDDGIIKKEKNRCIDNEDEEWYIIYYGEKIDKR